MTVFWRDNCVKHHAFRSQRAFSNENEDNYVLPSIRSDVLIRFKVSEKESVWDIDEQLQFRRTLTNIAVPNIDEHCIDEHYSSVNESWITFPNDMRFSWEYLIASIIEMRQSIQWLGGDLDSELFWIFLLVKKFWSGTSVCNVFKNHVIYVLIRLDIEKFPLKYFEHMKSSLNMAFETSYRV